MDTQKKVFRFIELIGPHMSGAMSEACDLGIDVDRHVLDCSYPYFESSFKDIDPNELEKELYTVIEEIEKNYHLRKFKDFSLHPDIYKFAVQWLFKYKKEFYQSGVILKITEERKNDIVKLQNESILTDMGNGIYNFNNLKYALALLDRWKIGHGDASDQNIKAYQSKIMIKYFLYKGNKIKQTNISNARKNIPEDIRNKITETCN